MLVCIKRQQISEKYTKVLSNHNEKHVNLKLELLNTEKQEPKLKTQSELVEVKFRHIWNYSDNSFGEKILA